MKIYKVTEHDKEKAKTTWGKAGRDWSSLPKNVPPPNNYNPIQFTEASHTYSFPKANRNDEAKIYKSSFSPAPGAYEIRKDEK